MFVLKIRVIIQSAKILITSLMIESMLNHNNNLL